MTSAPSVHHHPVLAGLGRFFEHTAAVVLGLILMILGLGLGVTMIMLPVGVVIGLLGVALVVGGLFVRIDQTKGLTIMSGKPPMRVEPGERWSRADGEYSAEAAEKSPSPTVLVVDAEPLARWSISEVLGERGYQVREAHDTLSAIEAFSRPRDVVLLNVGTPAAGDLRLLGALHRLSPATPIVLMTAFNSAELVGEAQRLGAYTVIEKPFEMTALAALVDRALAGAPVDAPAAPLWRRYTGASCSRPPS